MSDKLSIWEKVCRPPETALKKITGGRLSGMTDISPQWRYKAMTEQFGPVGIGWSYEIKKLWKEAGTDGQIAAFAEIGLIVRSNTGEWSIPIPGIGGSMFIAKESSGLRTSDEAYKMAVTDALSVAMKQLGVGADIYMGMWDGSKYKSNDQEKPVVKLDQKQKAAFVEQVRDALAKGDEHAVRQLWSEWDSDEKAILWGLFTPGERTTMKSMKAA